MRTTYVKPNSHTQLEATNRIDTVRCICEMLDISKDEWTALFFELGCQWVESTTPCKVLIDEQLQDAKNGFWAWFLDLWTVDDARILKLFKKLSYPTYLALKEDVVKNRYK